jgi:cation/acetate symporter
MDQVTLLTWIIVGLTFALYIGIAIWSRAGSTSEFYVAGKHVSPLANGMATAADWMSAASFIGMAGLIAFKGRDGSAYLMGWTGGYVLLALLLAPYLRKFGKFTVPDFVGERYYSKTARVVALICAIFVSFTYIAGQMRGVGVVFSRFLEVDINLGVWIGMAIVFFYATLGGMKGITYTQVAQYCVLIFAYLVPAIFISLHLTGNPIPQIGFGAELSDGTGYLLTRLDQVVGDLGFNQAYTQGSMSTINLFCLTCALMVGTAGLPHVIIRFFTVRRVKDARTSGAWALVFIAILYTTAPAIAAFARYNLVNTVNEKAYTEAPSWFSTWEDIDLIAWQDKNGDGLMNMGPGAAFSGKPQFVGKRNDDSSRHATHGQRLLTNPPSESTNEVYIDKDIIVLANPEIANLPPWVIALVAAGGLAAALSTAAGLLLVISTSISHDLMKKIIKPDITDKQELFYARCAATVAVLISGWFGIKPPGFVSEVVAFAFGLAAASFFPAIIMGIFSKKMNREGAISGMIVGILFTGCYIVYFRILPDIPFIANNVTLLADVTENHLWGINTQGIGTIGMVLNFIVAIVVCQFTPPPPKDVQDLVENIRIPRGATAAEGQH